MDILGNLDSHVLTVFVLAWSCKLCKETIQLWSHKALKCHNLLFHFQNIYWIDYRILIFINDNIILTSNRDKQTKITGKWLFKSRWDTTFLTSQALKYLSISVQLYFSAKNWSNKQPFVGKQPKLLVNILQKRYCFHGLKSNSWHKLNKKNIYRSRT